MAVGDHLFSVLHSGFNRRHGSESRSGGNRPHLDSAVRFQNVDEVPELARFELRQPEPRSHSTAALTASIHPRTGPAKDDGRYWQMWLSGVLRAGSLIDRVVDEAKLPEDRRFGGNSHANRGPELPVRRLRIELKLASGTEKAT